MIEQKIINVESGVECRAGEQGEILIRGPNVMIAYLNRQSETAATIDKDGFLHTGFYFQLLLASYKICFLVFQATLAMLTNAAFYILLID